MRKTLTGTGVTVSWETYGSGPPLVLIHGAFSDHRTNWEFVLPSLAERYTVHSIARRGRGATTATTGHTVEDEAFDAAAVLRMIGEPVYLLGHSYGAHVALLTASAHPARVSRLVLYEPAWPRLLRPAVLDQLLVHAGRRDWETFASRFFHEVLDVTLEDLEAARGTPVWEAILADAPASVGDLLAMSRYRFDAARFSGMEMPVLLQTGSESPSRLYATNSLQQAIPHARVSTLAGRMKA